MATAANPPPGAIPTAMSAATSATTPDPFLGPPSAPLRYASFDTDSFSMYSSNSPAHAKRALEAHLHDTDRRIQDASRLGTTLLQQRKELSARLEEVKQVAVDNEVPPELRTKLSELEREYNELGKESARAFLPKSRAVPTADSTTATPSVFAGQSRESPTKVAPPSSRRQRNQPSNRIHDIEFATDISTSLLAQVRQLQGLLAEKDDALRETHSAKAQLETEAVAVAARIKHMDGESQRLKDENWNLETKLQDLEQGHREVTDKHERVTQTLKASEHEKALTQRDLDELRASHEKLGEDHSTLKRLHEAELHTLRRDITNHESAHAKSQVKISDLTSQNTDLAAAVAARWNHPVPTLDREAQHSDDHLSDDAFASYPSEPASPVKGTPARHGMLESETLKSSLNHAHRMIQNLKNNIHREKTEKGELKRLLQDSREELENSRRNGGGDSAAVAKKRDSGKNAGFKKPLLRAAGVGVGANRGSTTSTEILEDEEPDWEDHEGERTPSKSRAVPAFDHAAFSGGVSDTERETTTDDAFETANERDVNTTTEGEAFLTAHDDNGDSSSGAETETGDSLARSGTARPSPLSSSFASAKKGDRRSYMSTASTSAGEDSEGAEGTVRTPVAAQGQRYRVRVNRGGRKSGGMVGGGSRGGSPMLFADSPGSSAQGTPQQAGGQTLGDELDALDDGTPGSRFSYVEGEERGGSLEPETPGRELGVVEAYSATSPEAAVVGDGDGSSARELDEARDPASPRAREGAAAHRANAVMLSREAETPRPRMVDAGVMTEAWTPEVQAVVGGKALGGQEVEPEEKEKGMAGRAVEIMGGALAGFGLGKLGSGGKEADGANAEGVVSGDKDEAGVRSAVALVPVGESDALAGASIEKDVPGNTALEATPAIASVGASDLDPVQRAAGPVGVAGDARDLNDPQPAPAPLPARTFLDEPKTLSTAASREALRALKEPALPAAAALPTVSEPAPPLAFQQSAIVSQETEPVQATVPVGATKESAHAKGIAAAAVPLAAGSVHQPFNFSSIDAQHFEPSQLKHRPIVPRRSSRRLEGLLAEDGSHRDSAEDGSYRDAVGESGHFSDGLIPGTEKARPGAGFFGAAVPAALAGAVPAALSRTRSQSMPGKRDVSASGSSRPVLRVQDSKEIIEPKLMVGPQGASAVPTLVFAGDDEDQEAYEARHRAFLIPGMPQSMDPNEARHRTSSTPSMSEPKQEEKSESAVGPSTSLRPTAAFADRSVSDESMIPVTRPLSIKKPMAEQGSQTMVSGDEVDDMLRDKSRTSSMATSMSDAGNSPFKAVGPRQSADGLVFTDANLLRGPRRPGSAGSMRSKSSAPIAPPLPADFNQKIAVAAQKAPSTPGPAVPGAMGPPVMPASAYKSARAKTPSERGAERVTSRDGTTPRPVKHRDSRQQVLAGPAGLSRRTSVSSFASELDERFNINRGQLMYPTDVEPSTDPRMIQAITQTMIGEYLWKYTRKAGRSEKSSTRHRRFFWVHPYTRTLYWSEQDPSTAGKTMLKAKSVAIQAVRVITDDNTYPPGLHRKSLVVVTPGREIVFTAPTGQRHETWHNALSYLLLRTEQEKGEAEDEFDQGDVAAEFNPGFSIRRSISRMTGGGRSQSRTSLSSYNSRGTRASSPPRRDGAGGSMSQRQKSAVTPTPDTNGRVSRADTDGGRTSRASTTRDTGSMTGRFSSLTSRFRAPSSQGNRRSMSTRRDRASMGDLRHKRSTAPIDPSEIYDASIADGGSAEDLRAVIERQEHDADRVENVRACCDGESLCTTPCGEDAGEDNVLTLI